MGLYSYSIFSSAELALIWQAQTCKFSDVFEWVFVMVTNHPQ